MHSLKVKSETPRCTHVFLDGREICCRSLVLDMGVDRISSVTMEILLDDVDVEVEGVEEWTET